jgi:ribonuclease G
MSKELIVSVNGREKKIAIIENGRVTEFYIERGEGTEGIVGNIYKGRVMRVLPGMQSAFVDIGLERDAFLYVSDFFDEEEEFERIVIDKSKAPGTERAAAERARIEREHRVETAQEVVEPLASAGPLADEVLAGSAAPGEVAEAEEVAAAGEKAEAAGGRQRGRRGQRERAQVRGAAVEPERTPPVVSQEDTPFIAGAASFERVIDEEEIAAEDGSMLKDAMVQERLMDQIHAIEFDMEETPTAQVGSILPASSPLGSSLQRIDDSDAVGPEEAEPRAVLSPVTARVEAFVDDVPGGSASVPQPSSFQRVSDDEQGLETPAPPAEPVAPETGQASRRGRSRRRAKEETSVQAAPESAAPDTAAGDQAETEARGARRRRATSSAAKKTRSSSRRKSSAAAEADAGASAVSRAAGAESEVEPPDTSAEGPTPESAAEPFADAEAGIAAPRSREEFARRGGRRRRRKHSDSANGEENGNGGNGGGEPIAEAAEPQPVVDASPASRRSSSSSRQRSGDGRSSSSRRSQPTITDLLREGQEILVQIAKEPISQKGARITSHIALPGRFLVYMPTIEHVGVSRKIESDSERARLRKLIQAIRAEEEVPSGGFIVRTAGVGISEEELRDDARYLVRTWLDIRRAAEKTKAPALVHRDLDLVQRILRDQLSDEFTAIRVDSEEEYTRIVEFVNRIQPRLVRRVKLYTRDEPILEAFGVQAEIDKAVKPRVWLRSGGYLVINQTEALVAIDVNTGKFVGRGGNRLEDTITRTNLEAVEEIVRQIRLRDLGGIIVLDLIDMEERRNRQRVMQALQEALQADKSPTKVLSFNDFGLVIMTRKRVKQSLERTLCSPCPYCQGSGLVKSPQTVCYEILEQARRLAKEMNGDRIKQATLRVNTEIERALRTTERDVLAEIEDHLGAVDITSEEHIHQEQFDFAII